MRRVVYLGVAAVLLYLAAQVVETTALVVLGLLFGAGFLYLTHVRAPELRLPDLALFSVTAPRELEDGPERAQRFFADLHRHLTAMPLIVHQLAWREEGWEKPKGDFVVGIPAPALKAGEAALRQNFRGCIVRRVNPEQFALYRPVFDAWEAERLRLEEEARATEERERELAGLGTRGQQ